MDLEEILHRKFYREQLEQSGQDQVRHPISCDDMSDSEKTSFIQFLVTESQKKDQQISHLQKTIDSQGERLNGMQITLDDIQRTQHATRNENTKLSAQLTTQGAHLKSMQAALKKALQQADKYKSLYEVLRDEKFVGTSQKYGKPRPEPGRDDNKGNWDVPAQDEPNIEEETDHKAIEEEANEIPKEKIKRPYREGLKYDKMQAQATVLHSCDRTRIPSDAEIIKTEIRSTFHYMSRLEEHRVEYITYRTKDGKFVTAFFPMKKAAKAVIPESLSQEVIKHFPRTHATVDLLVELVFNKYMMETPVYREMLRLFELKFKVSRQTILNWLSKGADALKKLIPVLKAQALEKDAIVNCDETWCRVKMQDKYKKAYIWCMVNKAAGIVIFFYDEGSRGRKVLTEFIGDAQLLALQSDAYNVYQFLDNELTKVEHIYCMAHVRARFRRALEQGKNEMARPFMQWIGKLYQFEREYTKEKLPPDEIKKRRNGAETTSIIASIWMELNRQLEQPLPKGNLMQQALTYLKNTWKHVMAYRNDGRYDIDNSIAERAIRTLTIERKNSMAFGSHRGAEISTVYHTFVATCKMKTLSFRKFLKEYFTAVMQGRTDYENLTPHFIGKNN